MALEKEGKGPLVMPRCSLLGPKSFIMLLMKLFLYMMGCITILEWSGCVVLTLEHQDWSSRTKDLSHPYNYHLCDAGLCG